MISTGRDSVELPMPSITEFTHLKDGWWLRADGLLFGGGGPAPGAADPVPTFPLLT